MIEAEFPVCECGVVGYHPALEHNFHCKHRKGFFGAPFERLPDTFSVPSGEWILDGVKYENCCHV